MELEDKFWRASLVEAMKFAREDERNRIIRLLEGINPGDGVLGDDLGLALIKGENE